MIPSTSNTIASHNAAKFKTGISARIPRINRIIPIIIEPIFVILIPFFIKNNINTILRYVTIKINIFLKYRFYCAKKSAVFFNNFFTSILFLQKWWDFLCRLFRFFPYRQIDYLKIICQKVICPGLSNNIIRSAEASLCLFWPFLSSLHYPGQSVPARGGRM